MPEIRMSFQRFAATVALGHPDHIWLGPLKLYHGNEQWPASHWRFLIGQLKKRPVKVGGRG